MPLLNVSKHLKKIKLEINFNEMLFVCLKIAIIILMIEGSIMMILPYFKKNLSEIVEAVVDVIFLLVLSTPLIAYFVIYPYIHERDKSEKKAQESIENSHKMRESLLIQQNEILEKSIKEVTQQIYLSEERYALAARGANDGLWDWNVHSEEIFYSDRFQEILGLDKDHWINTSDDWLNLIHPQDVVSFSKEFVLRQNDASQDHFQHEYRIRHSNGAYIWVLSRWVTIFDKTGKSIRHVGSQTDITSRKEMEQKLVYDAFHDPLTGLPNRMLFNDRLEQILVQDARNRDREYAVLYIDIDNFKYINDTLGHLAGDELLIEVSNRIRGRTRIGDTVARLGGDEFAIIINDVHGEEDLLEILQRLSQKVIKYFPNSDKKIPVTFSIGVVHLCNDNFNLTVTDILKNADIALYQAKAKGKNQFSIFQEDMQVAVQQDFELMHGLQAAIENKEMTVHFQPIVDLSSLEIAGFEALSRWKHQSLGWVSPTQFISLAEKTNFINEVGKYVLEASCKQLISWRQNNKDAQDWFITVNVSAKQLDSDSFIETLSHLIQRYALPPNLIKIEITENIFIMNSEKTITILSKIHHMGFKIIIDDFGTGYSSLNTLSIFPFDTLKVDKSFIQDIHDNKRAQDMVKFICGLSQTLNMKTVAEGIETTYQLEFLRNNNCQFGQGFLFDKPLPAAEIKPKNYQQKIKILTEDDSRQSPLMNLEIPN